MFFFGGGVGFRRLRFLGVAGSCFPHFCIRVPLRLKDLGLRLLFYTDI